MLLERESILDELSMLLTEAATAGGRFVAVCGEAGVGKSTLVEHFVRHATPGSRHLIGVCE